MSEVKTRNAVCKKIFVNTDGEEARHAGPDTDYLVFKFAHGSTVRVDVSTFPDSIQNILAWHGVAQKLGDAYAGESGDEAVDALTTVLERLTEGEWVRAGERAGPSTGLLVQAIVNLRNSAGAPVDPEAVKAKLADKANREAALRNAHIRAEYERLRAERAAERAAAMAAKAAGAETDNTDLLDF